MKVSAALPADILEAPFQALIVEAARHYSWMVNHQRASTVRPGRFLTATTGQPGFPDLVLARAGVVLLCEVKSNRGRLGPGQPDWAIAIGPDHHRLWRPRQWSQILQELNT